jgi:UDP-N-acetylmuramyl tripeptide synthase
MKATFFINILGKSIAKISRLKGGHGSALPGLVVEKIAPHFLRDILAKLPLGVAVISGTNGKTTTTKMVVELLRASGLKVFTNDSGSNFSRGVTSAAIQKMRRGKLNYDIAILELDEAHAVHFVREIQPNFSLLLNVLRDQLDRFGEIDTTANMLREIAKRTTKKVVLNANDPRISVIANDVKIPVEWFGISEKLHALFPTDEELHGTTAALPKNNSSKKVRHNNQAVLLQKWENNRATYEISGKNFTADMLAGGTHNALNGAAALALAKVILGEKFDVQKMIEILAKVQPAFGRGETFTLGDRKITLNLVKNPSGFRLVLESADAHAPTLIAINDAYADGRDVSWLFDVDFAKLRDTKTLFVTGIRAFDMALRLEYNDVKCTKISPEINDNLREFLHKTHGQNAQIFATYTAMLEIRKLLKREAK